MTAAKKPGEAPVTDRAARWDARYAAAGSGLFGEAPCLWLTMLCGRPDFRPASALLPADGDGRNGTWLAGRGVAVTAIDLSAEATRRARARDAAAGVGAERIAADLEGWAPPPGRSWDAVLIFYLQGPRALRRHAVEAGAAALAPGGWLAVEGFGTAQAGRPDMGPDDPDKLYAPAELAAWAAGLTLVEAMAGRVRLDEGPRHSGEAEIVRFLARRPG
jgi:hypothetical protein